MQPIAVDPAAPLHVVLNEGSGRTDAAARRNVIETVLRQAGRTHSFLVPSDGAPLRACARRAVEQAQRDGGVVVAAGGDGTINAVAQVVLGSGCVLGVVPQGTFNYFSRTHGIPEDPEAATQALLGDQAHPVQAGLVNDRLILVNASLGLYPKLLEDREAYTRQYGRSRAVALFAGLVGLLREHRQLRLQIEYRGGTREIRTPTLFVGNNRLQFEQLGIEEAPLLDEGQLAAIALKPVGSVAMLGLLLRGAFGRLGNAENITSFAFRRLSVRPWLPYGTRRVKVAIDGEVEYLRAPLEFRVSEQPLYLLKPAAPRAPGDGGQGAHESSTEPIAAEPPA